MNKLNDKNQRHGYWETYWSNGQLWYKGNYINGYKDGYWESYYSNGQLKSKGNYINGNEIGYWINNINYKTEFHL
jgi:antitoxin component YwqK of YwqJK toxin-antitoxin module